MAAKDRLGIQGERIAERHLVARGMTVVDRNWRCPQGEIDLVLNDGDETVFVEVKTRSSVAYGHPLEAITVVEARPAAAPRGGVVRGASRHRPDPHRRGRGGRPA